jgi:hypothetical protein
LWQALYGLKEALLLWYNNNCASLKKMGLKPVPGIPCLFTSEKLIIFFYVDDIVALVRPEDHEAHEEFERASKVSLAVTRLVHQQGCSQLQAAEEIWKIPSNSAQQGIHWPK